MKEGLLDRVIIFNMAYYLRIVYMVLAMVMTTMFIKSPRGQKYYSNILVTIIMISTGFTFMPEENAGEFITLLLVFSVAAFTTLYFLVKLIQVFVNEKQFLAKSIQEYHQQK